MTGLWYHKGREVDWRRNKEEAFILFLSLSSFHFHLPATISRHSLHHTQWTSDEKRIHFTSLQSSLFLSSLLSISLSPITWHQHQLGRHLIFSVRSRVVQNSTHEETRRNLEEKEFNRKERQGMTEGLEGSLSLSMTAVTSPWRRRARLAWRQNLICFC